MRSKRAPRLIYIFGHDPPHNLAFLLKQIECSRNRAGVEIGFFREHTCSLLAPWASRRRQDLLALLDRPLGPQSLCQFAAARCPYLQEWGNPRHRRLIFRMAQARLQRTGVPRPPVHVHRSKQSGLLQEAAKGLPSPPGGRPHGLTPNQTREVCRQIGQLYGEGVDLADAKLRMAQHYGASLSTIQRAWKKRINTSSVPS